jgi:fatty acid desaturase
MSKSSAMAPVNWYWPPIDRELLGQLSRKSDLRGFCQTLGFLAVLALTGSIAYFSGAHWPWYATAVLLLLHGTCWAFLSNGFHELSHGTVFATRWLNRAFLGLFSILSWNNPILFWASHTEHHKYTLHTAGDLEIDLEARPTLRGFLLSAVINPLGLYRSLSMNIRHGFGRMEGAWERHLFPSSADETKRRLVLWARILLFSHALLIAIAVYWHLWMLIVVVSLAKFYGGGIQWLCNEAQHLALPGNVDDFRLCSRTIYLNPLLEFMYWRMNYHIEHHMYAAVPCYRLVRLHAAVKRDMPASPSGLVASWRQINAILQRKKLEPGYQYLAPVPLRRTPDRLRAIRAPAQTVTPAAARDC